MEPLFAKNVKWHCFMLATVLNFSQQKKNTVLSAALKNIANLCQTHSNTLAD